jgi:hypothetical protein
LDPLFFLLTFLPPAPILSLVSGKASAAKRPEQPGTRDEGDAEMMTVTLSAGRNPDFASRSLPKRQTVTVTSLAEAVSACRDYIEVNDLGGGNWTGGQIKWSGRIVARVSYNGRVWESGPYPQPEILVDHQVTS